MGFISRLSKASNRAWSRLNCDMPFIPGIPPPWRLPFMAMDDDDDDDRPSLPIPPPMAPPSPEYSSVDDHRS
jgi:hypothetical protein